MTIASRVAAFAGATLVTALHAIRELRIGSEFAELREVVAEQALLLVHAAEAVARAEDRAAKAEADYASHECEDIAGGAMDAQAEAEKALFAMRRERDKALTQRDGSSLRANNLVRALAEDGEQLALAMTWGRELVIIGISLRRRLTREVDLHDEDGRALREARAEVERLVEQAWCGFEAFFDAFAAWSRDTFGPMDRYATVVAHIRKELEEVEAKPSDLDEWVDVALLAMDGAWRSAGADGRAFVLAMMAKDEKNRKRSWPDWRDSPGAVTEHIREGEEPRRRDEAQIQLTINRQREIDKRDAEALLRAARRKGSDGA